jgi:oligogalacturonide lyase
MSIGQRFPSEMKIIVDRITGAAITALTTSSASDAKIYQDHPQWMADGRWVIFRSNRGESDPKVLQAFAVDEITGDIVQLTEGPGLLAGTLNIARLSGKLYYLKAAADKTVALVELEAKALLDDSASGQVKSAAAYERLVAVLPATLRESGGFTLDADEKSAFVGTRELSPEELRGETLPPHVPGQFCRQFPSRLIRVDLADGSIRTVAETPFLMGHVQSNPWVHGEVVFCCETGGDAPQRMYTVVDGSPYRALYEETPDEWVTHEAVVTRDEVMFAIMGHLPRLRKKPTGIAVINLRTDEMKLVGQCDVGNGFWHVNGSPDGRWAVGDDFDGNIHLIDRRNGKLTTITTGHVMKPDHAHPTFSPDSTRILFQSGLLSGGRNLNLMMISIGAFE